MNDDNKQPDEKKTMDLKAATHILKREALKRYRQRLRQQFFPTTIDDSFLTTNETENDNCEKNVPLQKFKLCQDTTVTDAKLKQKFGTLGVTDDLKYSMTNEKDFLSESIIENNELNFDEKNHLALVQNDVKQKNGNLKCMKSQNK